MSYDLVFLRPKDVPAIPAERFFTYFSGRPNYTVNREARQATYVNEKTGVYFIFDVELPEEPSEDEDGYDYAGLAFNLNFVRPHTFGLEAEPELTAVVGAFGLAVEDPQIDGMGRGPYRPEGFIAGWSAGNAMAYRVVEEPVPTLPSAELRRIWDWNRGVDALQASLTEDAFVPTIMMGQLDGRPVSFVAWPDAIPMYMPKVDFVMLVRQRRRFLGLLPDKPEILCTPWQAFDWFPAFEGPYIRVGGPGPAEAFFRARTEAGPRPTALPIDQLLDAETMASAR